MSTVTNAERASLTRQENACRNIHDLTGIRTSDPATWPDYGVKSLGLRPACSLSRDALPLKGSCVRWKIFRSRLTDYWWIGMPTEGKQILSRHWHEVVEAVNAEVARRKRSANLGG